MNHYTCSQPLGRKPARGVDETSGGDRGKRLHIKRRWLPQNLSPSRGPSAYAKAGEAWGSRSPAGLHSIRSGTEDCLSVVSLSEPDHNE